MPGRWSFWIALLALGVMLGAGCGGDSDAGDADDNRDRDSDRDSKKDDDRDKVQTSGKDCECAPTEVCDVGRDRCIAPEHDSRGHFAWVKLSYDAVDDKAKIKAGFWADESLPEDQRQEYYTDQDEPCYVEHGIDSNYPFVYRQKNWPGPALAAGALTFEIAEGDTLTVEAQKSQNDLGAYYLTSDLDSDALPAGSALTMSAQGGDEIGALEELAGELPEDFEIEAPDDGDTFDSEKGLEIEWSPSQASAMMRVTISTLGDGLGIDHRAIVRCQLLDDGKATIPAEALGRLSSGKAVVNLTRRTKRYSEVDDLEVYLVGEYTQRVRLEDE
jgi:hypothetical protein